MLRAATVRLAASIQRPRGGRREKWGKVQGLSRERHGPGRVPDPPVRNDRDRLPTLQHDSRCRIRAFSSPNLGIDRNFPSVAIRPLANVEPHG